MAAENYSASTVHSDDIVTAGSGEFGFNAWLTSGINKKLVIFEYDAFIDL